MRLGLISDTHGRLRAEVFGHLADADRIFHAGDIGGADILAGLETIAPVDAVWGNTDGFALRGRLPESLVRDLAGRRILLVHGHQLGSPTPARLAEAWPEPDIVVFGHTHKPACERVGTRLFLNPGSAGSPRFGLRPSIGMLYLDEAREEFRLIEL